MENRIEKIPESEVETGLKKGHKMYRSNIVVLDSLDNDGAGCFK